MKVESMDFSQTKNMERGSVMKRFLSMFVLVLCMLTAVTPSIFAVESFTVNGVTVTSGSSKYVSNCAFYADDILKMIWGTPGTATFYNANNLLKEKTSSEREITVDHVKKFIQAAPLGSRIRICNDSGEIANNRDNNRYVHTMVLVAKDDIGGTFTTLESGWGASAARQYTYESFSNKWRAYSVGYKYFFYIIDMSASNIASSSRTSVSDISDGSWYVTIPANYKLSCYPSAAAASPSAYIRSKTNSYILICSKKAVLSNGTTRYYFVSGDNKQVWFNFESGMSVEDRTQPSSGQPAQNQQPSRPAQPAQSTQPTQPSQPAIYTISFDVNGGNTSYAAKVILEGDVYGELPTPSRSGYTFGGWYTSRSGGTRVNETTQATRTQTLYAHWYKASNTFTLYFNANGGRVSPRSRVFTEGERYGELPVPTRKGYTFKGWGTDPEGPTMIINASMEADASYGTTVYAVWEQNRQEGTAGNIIADIGAQAIGSVPPVSNTSDWSGWSDWDTTPVSSSRTRQVETRQIQLSEGHMEYRYGRYIDSTGGHCSWCGKYLEGLRSVTGSASLQYSGWTISRFNTTGKVWTCGYCNGNHTGIHHYSSDGRPCWYEYASPDSGNYFWEESRWVEGDYETQYRYRDRISN